MVSREAIEAAIKISEDVDVHIDLKSLPSKEAADLQRSRSLVCCLQFRAWIRSGRDSVRGIPIKDALKREQKILLWARHMREAGYCKSNRPFTEVSGTPCGVR